MSSQEPQYLPAPLRHLSPVHQDTPTKDYHPKDAIYPSIDAAAKLGFIGFGVASVRAALTKQNIGIFGAFTKYGSTPLAFGKGLLNDIRFDMLIRAAIAGGSFVFTHNMACNLRQKEDTVAAAIAGAVSGAFMGVARRTVPAVLGFSAATSIACATMQATGGNIWGTPEPNKPDYDEKERLRKTYRTSAEETVQQLGEGRGIYGPGYAERRKQRIKDNYGIDVP